MRFILALLAALPFSQLSAAPLNIATNCNQWIEVRQQKTDQATLYWLQGFVAAYNEYKYTGRNPQGVLRGSDPQVISGWLDSYCQKNPTSNPQEAVESLIEERKPAQKACPVKRSSGRPCSRPKKEKVPETDGY